MDAWQNSTLLEGDLLDEVTSRKATQDIVATGSAGVVRTLMEHDLVDEYRLLVFPTVVGQGTRLFGEGTAPIGLELRSVEPADPTVLLVYRRAKR